MAFADCILSARDQGALTRDEADELIARYEAHLASARAQTKGLAWLEPTAEEMSAAKQQLLTMLEAEAAKKEWIAKRNAEVIDNLARVAETYRPKGAPDVREAMLGVLENKNNALLGAPSVAGRRDALLGEAHGKMEQMLYDFRRKFWSGKRENPLRENSLIDEAFGTASGDSAAKGYLEAWRGVSDDLATRFNELGGEIRLMDDLSPHGGYFPQPKEDARILARMGEQKWVDFIKPLLGVQYMRDPLTRLELSPERLDEALHVIYWRKVTDGGLERDPTMTAYGQGALANRRTDHRFLIFKDGDAWRAYDAAMGSNGAYAAMMHHIDGLAKDVAALDVLGPNPAATVEWMKQFVDQEAAKAVAGQPSLYRGKPGIDGLGHVNSQSWQIERLWQTMRGGGDVGNMAAADLFQATRNLLMSAQLASTMITAGFTDPFQQANARRFAGVPFARYFAETGAQLFNHAEERQTVASGVIFQDAMEHLVSDVRKMGMTTGAISEASKYLPDRILTWTGLTPWTHAQRRGAANGFMARAADLADRSMADLKAGAGDGAQFGQWLEGFGIGEAEWDRLRATLPAAPEGMVASLRPIDVFKAAAETGDADLRELGLRYSEAVHAFIEEATPEGTHRVRAWMKGQSPAGTFQGEVSRSTRMYAGFPANVMLSMMNAAMHESAAGRAGWKYIMASVATLTLGGALLTQVRALLKGQDPLPVDSQEFWLEAFIRGGGGGIWGDYMTADMSRGGMSLGSKLAGPVAGLVFDTLGVINPKAALTFSDDQPNRTANAFRMASKYIPGQNMWWLKPVTQRLLWDQLQLWADPEAYRTWRRKEKRLRGDTGQGLWWGPGDTAPRRAPDFSTGWKR
jgi:hypothetical protein